MLDWLCYFQCNSWSQNVDADLAILIHFFNLFPLLQLTYADIAFFDLFNGWLAEGKPEVPEQLNKFPLLVEHYNRVLNVPEIKAWVEKRPESSF